jgi:hypothetical protein
MRCGVQAALVMVAWVRWPSVVGDDVEKLTAAAKRLVRCVSGQPRSPLREEYEGVAVHGSDYAEIPRVDCCYGDNLESFGNCDYGGVDGAEVHVCVALDQFCDALPVA